MIIIDRSVTDAVKNFVADTRGDALFSKDGKLGDITAGAGGVANLDGAQADQELSARVDVQQFLNKLRADNPVTTEAYVREQVTEYVDTHFANRGGAGADEAKGPLVDALVGVAMQKK